MQLISWNDDLFKYLHLYDGTLAKSLLWLIFIVFAVGVVVGSKYMSEYLVAWTARKNMKQSVAGCLILAVITSLPETTVAFTMGAVGTPQQTLANTLGGTSYYFVIFAAISLLFINKQNLTKISRRNKRLLYFGLIFAIFIFLALIPNQFAAGSSNWLTFMSDIIPGLNVSWLFVFFVITYLVIMIWFLNDSKKEELLIYDYELMAKGNEAIAIIIDEDGKASPKELKSHMSVKLIFFWFCLFAILLILCSFCLSLVVSVSPHVYNIPETVTGGVFLSFVTNMPELIATYFLLKMGKVNLAFGGLAGSLLYNNIINFFSDLTFFSGGTLNYIILHDQDYLQYFMLAFMQLVLLILTILKLRKFAIANKKISIILNVTIIVIFLLVWVLNLTILTQIGHGT